MESNTDLSGEGSYHREQLQATAARADIETLIASLVHDVNAHRSRVNGSLLMLGIDEPSLANNEWIRQIHTSTDNLRSLIWFYFDLLMPLVAKRSPDTTDDATDISSSYE